PGLGRSTRRRPPLLHAGGSHHLVVPLRTIAELTVAGGRNPEERFGECSPGPLELGAEVRETLPHGGQVTGARARLEMAATLREGERPEGGARTRELMGNSPG